jgi:hypothetical protein
MKLRVRVLSTLSLAGAVMLAAAGCHSSTEPDRNQLVELARREAQWKALAIHDYAFDYDVGAMAPTRPARVYVRADQVVRVVDRVTGAELALEHWPTMDSLFAEAAQVIQNRMYHPVITYDSQRGFPSQIRAESNVPDTGFTATVSNFVAGL